MIFQFSKSLETFFRLISLCVIPGVIKTNDIKKFNSVKQGSEKPYMVATCNSSTGWSSRVINFENDIKKFDSVKQCLKNLAWLLLATHPQGGQVESSILKRSFKELRTMIYLITSGTAHPNEPHF